MSPNTRKRKSLLANKATKTIKDFNLSKDDKVDLLALSLSLSLSLKQLGIFDQINFCKKLSKGGHLLTSIETRQAM